MLKNKKEREEYLSNKENWKEVFINNTYGIRLLKLKDLNIFRLEKLSYNKYLGKHWASCDLRDYEILENGCLVDISKSDLLQKMIKM